MARRASMNGGTALLDADGLGELIAWLSAKRYDVIGPVAAAGVIRFERIGSAADLAVGVADRQSPGSYRTEPGQSDTVFGHNNGPDSLKAFLYPADTLALSAERRDRGFEVEQPVAKRAPMAFVGCRACDLTALARLDAVLLHGPYADAGYAARRKSAFVVAVNCATVAPTCFCASVGAGPRPRTPYDLCLTERTDAPGRGYVVEVGSDAGAKALANLPHRPVPADLAELPAAVAGRAAARMVRFVDESVEAAVFQNREHAVWDDVGARCLTCGNCTAVCPTCFCFTVEDRTDLEGRSAERRRKWDSCFSLGFSVVNGGSVRYSSAARYRQWLSHKFHFWKDQFGSTGCVGCGRCITWCPVGIDLTEELRRLGAAV